MSGQTVTAVTAPADAVATGGAKRPTPAQAFFESWRSGSAWQAVGLTVMAFVFALILGAVLLVVSNPTIMSQLKYLFTAPHLFFGQAGDAIGSTYAALASGSVGSWAAITETTSRAAPLIIAGLGIALSFRVGLFNIGGQGQAIWGTLLAGFVGFTMHAPMVVLLPLAIIAGIVGGAVWSGIAGFLRAKFGANEVITTIMLNYVMVKLVQYILVTKPFQQPGSHNPISPPVQWNATYPRIEGTQLHLGFLLAIIAAVVVWWLLDRTKLGFQLRAVGANPNAAAAAGMNVPFVLTMTMVIAGALCGLAGAGLVLAPDIIGHSQQITPDMVGSLGFDAITVALLGRNKPVGTVLAGLLFGALNAGATSMQTEVGTPLELADVLQALIVMFVAAPMLVQTLAPFIKERRAAAAAAHEEAAQAAPAVAVAVAAPAAASVAAAAAAPVVAIAEPVETEVTASPARAARGIPDDTFPPGAAGGSPSPTDDAAPTQDGGAR